MSWQLTTLKSNLDPEDPNRPSLLPHLRHSTQKYFFPLGLLGLPPWWGVSLNYQYNGVGTESSLLIRTALEGIKGALRKMRLTFGP